MIRLRKSVAADLDFVIETERDPRNNAFIGQWSREQHADALSNPDQGHFIIEQDSSPERLGYLIALDVRNPDRVVNLKRIVVVDKDRGTGRGALRAFSRLAREQYGAEQIWLVVNPANAAARHVYQLEGYRDSGERTENGRMILRLKVSA